MNRVRAGLSSPFFWAFLPVVLFWPVIAGHHWVPNHDTLSSLFWYKTLLSHFSASGSFPLWLPELGWGQSVSLSVLVQQSPAHLLLMPLANWVPDVNAAVLFYVAMFLNETLFAVGTYLLCTRLYERKTTAVYITLVLSGTVVWTLQRWWNFQIFYHLPLALFLIHSGFADGKIARIFAGLSVAFLFSWVGNLIYTAPLQMFLCGVYLLFLWKRYGTPRLSRGEKTSTTMWALVLILSAVVPYLIISTSDPISFLSPSRAASGKLSYDTYLNYGTDSDLHSAIATFDAFDLGFDPNKQDADRGENDGNRATYAGAFFAIFLGLAALFSRSANALPILALSTLTFLLYLSSSSVVAPLLYFIPGFSYLRHLGLLMPLTRLFLILLSGFGFDLWLSAIEEGRDKRKIIFAMGLFAVFAVLFHHLFFFAAKRAGIPGIPLRYAIVAIALLGLFLATLRAHWGTSAKSLGLVICVLAFLDVFSYRSAFIHNSMTAVSDDMWKQLAVEKPEFARTREAILVNLPAFKPWFNLFRDWAGVRNTIAGPFLGQDLCYPTFRMDLSSPYTEVFAKPMMQQQPMSAARLSALGCAIDKIQVVSSMGLVATEKAVWESLGSNRAGVYLSQNEQSQYLSEATAQSVFSREQSPEPQVFPNYQVKAYRWNELSLSFPAVSSGRWLYYAEAWSPFWTAKVDGNDTAIARANLGFQAVWVPAGAKAVQFIYEDSFTQMLFIIIWCLSLGIFGLVVLSAIYLLSKVAFGTLRFESPFLRDLKMNRN